MVESLCNVVDFTNLNFKLDLGIKILVFQKDNYSLNHHKSFLSDLPFDKLQVFAQKRRIQKLYFILNCDIF